jgi:Zn-dependent metalloprotease
MKFKLFFVLFLGVVFLFFSVNYFYFIYQEKSAATFNLSTLDGENFTSKNFLRSKKINRFTFYTSQNKAPRLNQQVENLGLKAFTGQNLNLKDNKNFQTLLPEKTINQLSLKKKFLDSQSPSFIKQNLKTLSGQHFYYEQNINNIPVYGAVVNMHLNNDQLYAFDGTVTTESELPMAKVSEEKAQEIALDQAKKDSENKISFYIYQSEKIIINKKILGISDDESNHLTQAVWVRSDENSQNFFSRKYFVDLFTGEIIYQEDKLIAALNREIKSCTKGTVNCQTLRTEGQNPVSDTAVNKTYDILGKTYNFYFDSFKRDSYDGNGAKLVGLVHFIDSSCPNAYADPVTNWIFICDGMYAQDVIAHELTHLVTGNRLIYQNQSGAMNESISDIFAIGTDNNWTLGEDTVLGVIRYADDPTKKTKYTPAQPDRLFSQNYFCGNLDDGGVHVNNGILNKTFYLMAEGGSFNGCSLQPVGMAKAHLIIYRALTTYVTPTANFADMFDYINRSCNDLYGEGSADCLNVKKVMQATEMDQQPAGSQTSPKCSGQKPKTPACVNNSPPSTSPTNSPTSSPTSVPTATPQPTLPPLPTVPITPTGNVELDLKLKFQGVGKKPADEINKLFVKVTLVSDLDEKNESYGIFTADNQATWSGQVFFNLKEISPTAKYKILIKGPMHLQKKICDPSPSETKDGYYQCSLPNILLKQGKNFFDFSKITLLAGDLPIQDGIVNAYDLSLIRQRLGVKITGPQLYDLNLDGVINTQDYSLILYTLSTRFDE